MNLNDYENDPYAPRPKASQAVAATKRAQQDSAQPSSTPARMSLPFGISALVLILLMIGAASYQLGRLPSGRPLAVTPGPSTAAFFGAAPTAAPAPTMQPTIAPDTHIASAYAAPDGALLGPVDLAGELVIAVGRAGSAWVQLERGDHSRVWFKRADLPSNLAVPNTLPDLSPRAAPVPQTGQGMPSSGWTPPDATSAPDAAPALVEPTATIVWATSAPAKIQDFDDPDIRGTCQFIGCLGQNAVDLERAQACHALYWQYGDADSEDIPEPDLSAVRGCIWEGLYH